MDYDSDEILEQLIRNDAVTEHWDWPEGYITGEDNHCFVMCQCGKEFSASDWKFAICPGCGRGYITRFVCYRIPADTVKATGINNEQIS